MNENLRFWPIDDPENIKPLMDKVLARKVAERVKAVSKATRRKVSRSGHVSIGGESFFVSADLAGREVVINKNDTATDESGRIYDLRGVTC